MANGHAGAAEDERSDQPLSPPPRLHALSPSPRALRAHPLRCQVRCIFQASPVCHKLSHRNMAPNLLLELSETRRSLRPLYLFSRRSALPLAPSWHLKRSNGAINSLLNCLESSFLPLYLISHTWPTATILCQSSLLRRPP